ncbi:MAG TPA: FAD-dependent oxidoreductase [Pseudomonadales bacterium]|nr:FAD-dependent oxidoreductase [Pseudomonadales bacterium]
MDMRRLALVAVILAAIIAFFVLDLGRFLSLDYLAAQRDALIASIDARPLLSAAVYFLVYVIVTGLSLPGAAVMTLAGGALFGLFWGLVLVSFASSIGATLAFLASRFLLRDWVQARFGAQLERINSGVERDGAFYLFSMRLVPVFPFFVINLVMGVTPIRTVTFYVASQLGMLAGTVVYVYAGTQLATLDSPGDVFSGELLLAFLLLASFPWIAKAITNRLATRRALAAFTAPQAFDDNLVVIGAGSGGLIASLIAATVKAKVTLIERGDMGGDCLNTGCVPSKALITSARVAKTLSEAPRFGLAPVPTTVDFAKVMARVHEAIAIIEPNDSAERYESLGVKVVKGEARIVNPWTVEVNGTRITTRNIVIATGGTPLVPPIPGLADVEPLTSDNVWALEALPANLLVMGGGPIGCELAQSFARLGSKVTLVDMAPRILPREDADAAAEIAGALEADGVVLRTGHKAVAFRGDGSGGVLETETDEGPAEIAFDRVLVAVGRRAVTAGLGLDELGVRTNRDGTLEVNDYLQTSIPTIYGCGDVVGPYQFTHIASHQAWFAAVNALFGTFRRFKVNYSVVPWCTYTEPEVARVGLSEDEAAARGVAVEVSTFEFAHNDRAIAESARAGFVKVLTPASGSDKILGVAIVGPHAGELLAEWTLAMTHGLGLKKLMGTIHVYPTLSEINKSAASTWRKKHAPEALLEWVGKYHAWRR